MPELFPSMTTGKAQTVAKDRPISGHFNLEIEREQDGEQQIRRNLSVVASSRSESQGLFFETRAEEYVENEMAGHFNIFEMSRISFETLQGVYKMEFPYSEDYKELVIRLHDNVIEYSFLAQAGLIKPSNIGHDSTL